VFFIADTTGKVETNHLKYGSTYSDEVAKRLITVLKLINTITEFTASKRVGVSRFTFPKGNLIFYLGVGLTNEEGAMVKVVSATEIEGLRNVGRLLQQSRRCLSSIFCGSVF
jgi:putative alpha-1,2-mannosidase